MQIYVVVFSEKHVGMTGYYKIFMHKNKAIEYLKTIKGFTRITDTLYRNKHEDELEICNEELVE